MPDIKTLNWFIGNQVFVCAIENETCPKCTACETIVELPPPLKVSQPDSTTHVCHPILGGCNNGFARGGE